MPWKPIEDQMVVASLGGKVRQVQVTAWHSDTGAVKVDWPPRPPSPFSSNRLSHTGRTKLDKAFYEPLDPEGFTVATGG